MFPVFNNVGERSTAKTTCPVSLLSLVSKVFEKLVNNIAIYADYTTLYSKCDQESDLWQQLELASELESGLRHTVEWVGSGC